MPKCERCPAEATVALDYRLKCEGRTRLYCDACAPGADPRAPFTVRSLRPQVPPDRKR